MKTGDKEITFETKEEFETFKTELTKGMMAVDTLKNLEEYFKNKALITKRTYEKLLKKASLDLIKQVKKGSVIRHREKR